MRMFDKLLKQAPIFKDVVLAIGNLTKSVNDLVKAYSQVAKMVVEDRQAINDLYNLHAELILERARAAKKDELQPSRDDFVKKVVEPSVDIDVSEPWDVDDKKKKEMN